MYTLHYIQALIETDMSHGYNWASEASPTLGCSIEISRDMYVGRSVGLSKGNPYKKYVCQKCVGRIT